MRTTVSYITTVLVLLLGFQPTYAASVQGDYLGTFAGNDSAANLLTELGLDVTELAKVETPATANDGLGVSNLTLNGDNEPIAGDWSFAGPDVIDYFVVKAGNQYAVYEYNDSITGNMPNMGIWDTTAVSNKGMSHVTGYASTSVGVVPVPAAVWFMGTAILALITIRRRR